MKKASIIIVNWNGRHLLKNCLDSVVNQTYENFEVILVDNASSDGSISFVAENYPSILTVSLDDNRGFTGGNIAGFEVTTGDYIVLVNNDVRLVDEWLQFMVTAIETEPSIGLCSSKIIIDGTSKIDSAGDVFTTAFTGTKIGEMHEQREYSERCFVPGACAAAVIYKRELLDDIGFLDDDFFLNHEDTDLNLRAMLAGWKCLYVPEAVAYHKVSASIVPLSDTAVYFFSRNNEWLWVKNVPYSLLVRSIPARIIYELSSFFYFCVLAGRWRPFLKGKWDAIKGMSIMLKKRKVQRFPVRLSDRDVIEKLVPIASYLRSRLKIECRRREK